MREPRYGSVSTQKYWSWLELWPALETPLLRKTRFFKKSIDLTRPTLTYSESASKVTLGIRSSVRHDNVRETPLAHHTKSSVHRLQCIFEVAAYLWWRTRTELIFSLYTISSTLSRLVQSVLSWGQWFRGKKCRQVITVIFGIDFPEKPLIWHNWHLQIRNQHQKLH